MQSNKIQMYINVDVLMENFAICNLNMLSLEKISFNVKSLNPEAKKL
jgi:hypothetical protein